MNWYQRKIGRKLKSFKSSKAEKERTVEQPKPLTHEVISFPVQPETRQTLSVRSTGNRSSTNLTGMEGHTHSHNELFKTRCALLLVSDPPDVSFL